MFILYLNDTFPQNLGPQHIELILEFSLWVLLQSPEEGLAIFTEDMDTVEALPRGQVSSRTTFKIG